MAMVALEKDANVAQQDGFAARLRQVVAAYGSTIAMARDLSRSEGAVRKWLRGQSEPNVSDLRKICEVSGTSVEWLVTGRGHRLGPTQVRSPSPSSGAAIMRVPFDYQLHDDISTLLDEELRTLGIEVPTLKRSSMIGMLYDRFQDTGQIDREYLARMARLTQL
jgi:transcriptional regulator with XRE-family HTH domain